MAFQRADAKVLILGTGIAGLSTALKFARHNVQVTVVCKAELTEGSTRYAQGGIASVWSKDDRFEDHQLDTIVAGAGLCHPDVVELCVKEGPARVQELIDLGVEFTRENHSTDPAEEFNLHREGGHGQRRILHAADLTGWEIERALVRQLQNFRQVKVLQFHTAIDLITEGKLLKRWRKPGRCLGAYVLDENSGTVLTLEADLTVLATGGASKVYLYTTNPDTTTGDGIAMAYRAGARVANLEFMQFHPTCLFHPEAKTFLISEALRGEGAVLKNLAGEEFMLRHHEMGSLAPRDIVARAIDMEMKRTGDRHVWLDCTAIDSTRIKQGFPNIAETCKKFGIDLTSEPIPVVPACHYTCGGVVVNSHAEATIEGLYAVGEVACTGVHGANRLASNSLLEAVVFADRAFHHGITRLNEPKPSSSRPGLPPWEVGAAVPVEEQIDIAALWHEIRSVMWNYVGIVRSDRRLESARRRIDTFKTEINTHYWKYLLTKDLIELRNLVTVADLIVQCATLRKESRGLHFTIDYPDKDDFYFMHDTVI